MSNQRRPVHFLMGTAIVLASAASLLLAACATTDNAGNKQDPTVFGNANGVNGAAGLSTGMSFDW